MLKTCCYIKGTIFRYWRILLKNQFPRKFLKDRQFVKFTKIDPSEDLDFLNKRKQFFQKFAKLF